MSNRWIKSSARGGAVQLTDCLHSLFALELMCPSPEMYLISPFINDVPLLSNRFGQFRTVMGDNGEGELRMKLLLTTLAERGTHIHILYRPDDKNEEFLRALPDAVERRSSETLHEKGLITAHFYLRGSMDFTYSGVNLNDESIELTTDAQDIALALIEVRQRWEEARDE
jgi:hypothetical protein